MVGVAGLSYLKTGSEEHAPFDKTGRKSVSIQSFNASMIYWAMAY